MARKWESVSQQLWPPHPALLKSSSRESRLAPNKRELLLARGAGKLAGTTGTLLVPGAMPTSPSSP